MNGRRIRGVLYLLVLAAIGWWIYDRRPTVPGLVDELTRPLLGSRAAVKEAEHKRVVQEASQVVNLDREKPVEALRSGMTDLEVRDLLGEPDEVEKLDDEATFRVRWIYRDLRRNIVFERRRVVSIVIR
ncbi:MAG: outer membrane protein assembly factor BamE [Acidobacteriota bacterium]|nr:outer membrane protein assembly factor BamE [Acidobacteriota bacterium]MDQ5873545.1 outer membrane protein assembly factor BamE [Acidobacteriota bacterium]